MTASVRIPTVLRPAMGGEALVDVEGATIGEVLERIDALEHKIDRLENRCPQPGTSPPPRPARPLPNLMRAVTVRGLPDAPTLRNIGIPGYAAFESDEGF